MTHQTSLESRWSSVWLAATVLLTLGLVASCSTDSLRSQPDATQGEVLQDLLTLDAPVDLTPVPDILEKDAALEAFDVPPEVLDLQADEASSDLPEVTEVVPGETVADLLPELTTETLDCDCLPGSAVLTVNNIPIEMNGSMSFLNNSLELQSFRLALPTFGFSVDVALDIPCGFDPLDLSLTGTVSQTSMAVEVDLKAGLDPVLFQGTQWHVLVPEGSKLGPSEEVNLTISGHDLCGNELTPDSLVVETVEMTPELHPFLPEDPWLLTYDRDFHTIESVPGSGLVPGISVTQEPNGQPDFFEDLRLGGLTPTFPTTAFAEMVCPGGVGGEYCVATALLQYTRDSALEFVGCPALEEPTDCTGILFWLPGEEGAPEAGDFILEFLDHTESARQFSILGFGGLDPDSAAFGRSKTCDFRNVRNEDNSTPGYGIFTCQLIRLALETLAASDEYLWLVDAYLGDFLPWLGGTPLGELEGDHLVVDFSIPSNELTASQKARRTSVLSVLELLGYGLGALVIHEIAHSVGLVPPGAPPYGLFGQETQASFIESAVGSSGCHVDTAGMNLMQSGPASGYELELSPALLSEPIGFNELNMAYLRGRLIVLPFP